MTIQEEKKAAPEQGCLICGAKLLYQQKAEERICALCGKAGPSEAVCANHHFVCDACHREPAFAVIRRLCLDHSNGDPLDLAQRIMDHPAIHIHGPEHHFLVPAVLLATAPSLPLPLESALDIAAKRAKNVLGGFCGFYGACGAAVGSGIFASILLEATPYADTAWGKAQALTGRILLKLAEKGGPRCCKRSTFTALRESMAFAGTDCGVHYPLSAATVCHYHHSNRECKGKRCDFFPLE